MKMLMTDSSPGARVRAPRALAPSAHAVQRSQRVCVPLPVSTLPVAVPVPVVGSGRSSARGEEGEPASGLEQGSGTAELGVDEGVDDSSDGSSDGSSDSSDDDGDDETPVHEDAGEEVVSTAQVHEEDSNKSSIARARSLEI